jgi:uncharacterized protein
LTKYFFVLIVTVCGKRLAATNINTSHMEVIMKRLDVLVAVLLVVGGLNWGLVGFFGFDLVAALFGENRISSLVYGMVGLSALYQIIQLGGIQRRWAVSSVRS